MLVSDSNPSSSLEVFLSYSSLDEELMKEARDFLDKNNITYWLDKRDMIGGEDVLHQLRTKISETKCLVVLVSRNSKNSEWVWEEMRLARQEGVCILPIVWDRTLSPEDLPYFIRKINLLKMWEESGKNRLLHQIQYPQPRHRIPTVINRVPDGYIRCKTIFDELKRSLLGDNGLSDTQIHALVGMGGIGKTCLVADICLDSDVQKRFVDGIFWVQLDEEQSREKLAKNLNAFVKTLTKEEWPEEIDALVTRLVDVVARDDVLIVVDKVLLIEITEIFNSIIKSAKNVRLLVTTQYRNVVPYDARPIGMGVMEKEVADQVISFGFPANDQFLQLAQQVGYWPWILRKANQKIHNIKHGMAVDKAVVHVSKQLRDHGLFSFDTTNSQARGSHHRHCLDLFISSRYISEEERELLLNLAIFPDDVDIPHQIIIRFLKNRNNNFGGVAVEDLLFDRCSSLFSLWNAETETVRCVSIVQTQLRFSRKDQLAGMHGAFLDGFSVPLDEFCFYTHSDRGTQQEQQYILHHMKHHLQQAGRHTQWFGMLLSTEFIAKRTLALGSTTETLLDLEESTNAKPDVGMAKVLFRCYKESAPFLLENKTWREMEQFLRKKMNEHGKLLMEESQ